MISTQNSLSNDLPQPKFVVKGILNVLGIQRQLYKRDGYISEYEINQEIRRLNRVILDGVQNDTDNKLFRRAVDQNKISVKFVLEITIAGTTTKQTLVSVNLAKEWN